MGLLDQYDKAKRYAAGLLQQVPQNAQDMYQGLLSAPQQVADLFSQQKAQQLAAALKNPPKANPGQWMDQGMELSGMAPVVGMGGIIKEFGKMPKKGILPSSVTPEMVPVGIPQMFGTGMSGTIKKMTTGDFLGRYTPAWMGEGKPFYAIGDNADELKQFMLDKIARSESGTVAAKTAKTNKSLLGKITKEFGDVFDTAKSTQSKSEYYTHTPSGLKIRISDHDLPLHYEQPDVDLRTWMSDEDKLAAIKRAIYGE